MKTTFSTVFALALMAAVSQASFVVDTFEDVDSAPGKQTGNHDSTPGGSAVSLDDPTGVATMRTLTGRALAGLVPPAIRIVTTAVPSSLMDVTLADGESATLAWVLPAGTGVGAQLQLEGYTPAGAGTGTFVVRSDGIVIGSGTVGEFLTLSSEDASSSALDITFTGGAGNLIFSADSVIADSITSTPEPASMGLLGLAVAGGLCGWRRRRKRNS